MDIKRSDIVESTAGRDAGMLFFVIGTEENFVFLADGRGRKIESPKRKKLRHIRFTAESGSRTAVKLREGEKVTNSELRRALAEYRLGVKEQEGK